jgi:hypothetical protein
MFALGIGIGCQVMATMFPKVLDGRGILSVFDARYHDAGANLCHHLLA